MSFKFPKEWEQAPFANLFLVPLRNGIYKKKEFHGRGAKIVNMGELFRYPRLKHNIEMKRVEITEQEIEKVILKNMDLIFARRSLTADGAGKCSIVISVSELTTFESSIIRVRLNQKIASPEFYYYLFNSIFGKWLLSTILRQVAVSGITGTDLAKLYVPIPPLPTQKKIANILSTLDDKIELNRKMNQTLEAMAQALFKSWFVDFDPVHVKLTCKSEEALKIAAKKLDISKEILDLFPNEFEESELGMIPKGWEWKKFGDVLVPKKGKNITKETITEGSVPVVAGGLTPAYYHSEYNAKAPVITISASGANAGYVNLYNQNIWASDCSYINSEMTNVVYSMYLFLSLKQDEITRMQQGAAQPHVYPKDLMRLVIATPNVSLWGYLEKFIEPMFKQIENNEKEIEVLKKTRDTLLPKLLSGELDVSILELDGGIVYE